MLAACCLLTSCQKQRTDDEEDAKASHNVQVAVAVAEIVRADAIVSVSAFGKTDALKKEKVVSPVAGKISSLRVFEGTRVKRGDVLVLIQSKESYTAELGAEMMLQTASTPEQQAEAKKALALAKRSEKNVTIASRSDGYVSTRDVSEGDLVAENAELLTVVDLSTIDFLADVQLKDLPSIHPGQRATVRFQSMPGKEFPASVAAINPQSDIQSQTVKVRLQFSPMDGRLRALLRTEMMGEARINIGLRKGAMFVPKTAVLRNDEENTFRVVTITPDSLARSIPVAVGIETDSTSEIIGAGLQAGMAVITAGNYSLNDSTRVTTSRMGGE